MKKEQYSYGMTYAVLGVLLLITASFLLLLFIIFAAASEVVIQMLVGAAVTGIGGASFLGTKGIIKIDYKSNTITIKKRSIALDQFDSYQIVEGTDVIRSNHQTVNSYFASLFGVMTVNENGQKGLVLLDKSEKFSRIYSRAVRLVKASDKPLVIFYENYSAVLTRETIDLPWSEKISTLKPVIDKRCMPEDEEQAAAFLDEQQKNLKEELTNSDDRVLPFRENEKQDKKKLYVESPSNSSINIHYHKQGRVGVIIAFFFIGLMIDAAFAIGAYATGDWLLLIPILVVTVAGIILFPKYWRKFGWLVFKLSDFAAEDSVHKDTVTYIHLPNDGPAALWITIYSDEKNSMVIGARVEVIQSFYKILNKQFV